jgi:hypothetical protein
MARTPTDIRSLARTHDAMAIRVLAGIARQKTAPPAARVAACKELLDRGHGKSEQSQDFNANVQVTIRRLLDVGTNGSQHRSPQLEHRSSQARDVTPAPAPPIVAEDTGSRS